MKQAIAIQHTLPIGLQHSAVSGTIPKVVTLNSQVFAVHTTNFRCSCDNSACPVLSSCDLVNSFDWFLRLNTVCTSTTGARSSGLPPLEAPVIIAEKHIIFFIFFFLFTGGRSC